MKRQKLIYGDSQTNADMLYMGGVFIPDPFFAFTLDDEYCALLSPLEIGRAKKTSRFDRIFDYSEIRANNSKVTDYCTALAYILRKNKVRSLTVSATFPAFALDKLRALGFNIKVADGEFFPERAVKSRSELKEIIKANSVASVGFHIVEDVLRESRIDGNKLIYRGEVLTSEFLRRQIERVSLELGADAISTIVASGKQACDPHECGHGAIAPYSLIVVDIFPRMRESGYFGDMTRTFIKGLPTDAQFNLVNSVLKAQSSGLSSLREGVSGAQVHEIVANSMLADGYKTQLKKGAWEGFFHSTGHGIGLEVHEAPSLNPSAGKLVSGNVVTVEPGLYYKEIGACRIEDNAVIQKNGAKILSEYHYNWIIE